MRTPAEITAYVMGLPVEDVRRLTATDVMGWTPDNYGNYWVGYVWKSNCREWRPDTDRNQSRQVTDKVSEYVPVEDMYVAMGGVVDLYSVGMFEVTPDQESRAALIAHMIHAEEAVK